MKHIILLMISAMVIGCVNNRTMTRNEWIQYTSHHYPNATAEQVLLNAEKLFTLADGNDFRFVHTNNKLYATRQWSFYAVIAAGFGNDHWVIETTENNGGVDVQVNVGTAQSSMIPLPTAGGDTSAGTLPGNAMPPNGNAIYDLFWRRMDYLMGVSDKWVTCQEADSMNDGNKVWGNNEALCNGVNIDDVDPNSGESTYKVQAEARNPSEYSFN